MAAGRQRLQPVSFSDHFNHAPQDRRLGLVNRVNLAKRTGREAKSMEGRIEKLMDFIATEDLRGRGTSEPVRGRIKQFLNGGWAAEPDPVDPTRSD